MALTSFDFQQARVRQVLFKSRLRSVLYGVREAEPSLFSPTENPLGQWLNTMARPHYAARPEMRELDQLLQQILRAGQQLADRYQRGQIEEARAGLDQVNTLADRFDVALNNLEKAAA